MTERTPAESFRDRVTGTGTELTYAGFKSFLKSDIADVSDVGDADAAVLGAPYDGAVSNRPGARYGPNAIRAASGWWAYLSGYKGGLTNMRTGRQVDYSALSVVDCGDVPVFPMNAETTRESIRTHVATVAQQGAMPILLGGDHSCTFPAVDGFVDGTNHNSIGIVQIDAHTDTVDGSAIFDDYFHGSSTHHLTQRPYVNYGNVSQVAIRGYESPGFFEFVDETGLNLFTMNDVRTDGIASVVEKAVEAASEGTDAVYVTFDIDAIDPSYAPGTGTPEPGGISADQALTVMEVLGVHDAVGAADLMEVAPSYDPTDNTQRIAAYLVITLLERLFAE